MEMRHEECLLSGSLTQKLQRQSSFLAVREVLQILLSVFWLRTSPKNFYQNVKVPTSRITRLNIRIVIYLDDMLLLVRSSKEVLIATDTDFLVATCRICSQPQKVNSDSPLLKKKK